MFQSTFANFYFIFEEIVNNILGIKGIIQMMTNTVQLRWIWFYYCVNSEIGKSQEYGNKGVSTWRYGCRKVFSVMFRAMIIFNKSFIPCIYFLYFYVHTYFYNFTMTFSPQKLGHFYAVVFILQFIIFCYKHLQLSLCYHCFSIMINVLYRPH